MTLSIQNIGPIKDSGIMHIRPVTLLMGPQSAGKSTVLKLLSFCAWVEKHVLLDGKTTIADLSKYGRFLTQLTQFHRFGKSFFTSRSSFRYESDNVMIELEAGKKNVRISQKKEAKTRNVKISFIPAERNLVGAVPNLMRLYRTNTADNLFNFILEWDEAKVTFTSEQKLPLSVMPGMSFHHTRNNGKDHLTFDDKDIDPYHASSGIQSALPLEGMLTWVTKSVGTPGTFTPGAFSSQAEKEGKYKYQSFKLFIEEPEQNLFPQSQQQLIRKLVDAVGRGRSLLENEGQPTLPPSYVVLTTHSPYVLTALNVLMRAAEAAEIDLVKTAAVVGPISLVPKDKFAAYQITPDGHVLDMVDREDHFISGEWLDAASNDVEDALSRLTDIVYAH